jgi:hypothetical protein
MGCEYMPQCFIQVWSEGCADIFPHEEQGGGEQDHQGEHKDFVTVPFVSCTLQS